jgi:hypothetical protein
MPYVHVTELLINRPLLRAPTRLSKFFKTNKSMNPRKNGEEGLQNPVFAARRLRRPRGGPRSPPSSQKLNK